jgi:hypothetical protein
MGSIPTSRDRRYGKGLGNGLENHQHYALVRSCLPLRDYLPGRFQGRRAIPNGSTLDVLRTFSCHGVLGDSYRPVLFQDIRYIRPHGRTRERV